MLDIKFLRQNPDVVKENIKKKFQDEKLPLVDEVIELDKRNREIKGEVEALRAEKNKVSKEIGACMAHGEKEKAEELKKKVQENAARMEELSKFSYHPLLKFFYFSNTVPLLFFPNHQVHFEIYRISRRSKWLLTYKCNFLSV